MRYKAGLETRDRILEATRSLIAEKGLEGTTIKAICHQAGVLPGSFYNLFTSKEQAILTVVREAIDAVDPDPEHHGTDTLDELVVAYVRFLEEQPDLSRVYIRIGVSGAGSSPELTGRMIRHHRERVERFAAALRRQNPEISETLAARRGETLVLALNGIALHKVIDPAFDVGWHARALLDDAAAVS
ncbi:MAG TPA: TetR/AcrR family transcriptional regulator [Acidimicrobiia bacterium]|jgi:AcrR family transcriptional regulator